MQTFHVILVACLVPSVLFAENVEDSLTRRVESFLQPRLLAPEFKASEDDSRSRILLRPDPGTFFLRYAFGLKQHAKKLLDTDQTTQLDAVLAKHLPVQKRWHDERNVLRCKYNQVMWRYAADEDSKASQTRSELESWMRLRMIWTQQEHLAQYRFARDVWQVLTVDQRQKLIDGQWKDYAVQNTGHTRSDATAKLIIRALGKPDNQAAFDVAVASWSSRRLPLHKVVQRTENDERCIVFAMDLNDEQMAYQASQEATSAYSALFLAEADGIRQIVTVAYREPAKHCAIASMEAWGEAEKRFTEGATELLALLALPLF